MGKMASDDENNNNDGNNRNDDHRSLILKCQSSSVKNYFMAFLITWTRLIPARPVLLFNVGDGRQVVAAPLVGAPYSAAAANIGFVASVAAVKLKASIENEQTNTENV